jgi:hypothetical protein
MVQIKERPAQIAELRITLPDSGCSGGKRVVGATQARVAGKFADDRRGAGKPLHRLPELIRPQEQEPVALEECTAVSLPSIADWTVRRGKTRREAVRRPDPPARASAR